MLGELDDEIAPARPSGGEVKFSADRKHRIMHGFRFKFAAVLPPEQRVSVVDFLRLFVPGARRLTVGLTHEDKLVQLFHRAAKIIAESHRQPVEQFGMRWQHAHASKIIRCFHEAPPEMIEPHTIGDTAPGERIAGISDPLRQSHPALTLGCVGGKLESSGQLIIERAERSGRHLASRHGDLAAGEEMNGTRLAAIPPGAAEISRAIVDGSRKDNLLGGKLRQVLVRCFKFSGIGGTGEFRGFIESFCDQGIPLFAQLGELLPTSGRCGINAIGEIFPRPAHGGFNAVNTRHRRIQRHVFSARIECLQFRKGKNEIVLSWR